MRQVIAIHPDRVVASASIQSGVTGGGKVVDVWPARPCGCILIFDYLGP